MKKTIEILTLVGLGLMTTVILAKSAIEKITQTSDIDKNQTYIVQLTDASLSRYGGELKGLEATRLAPKLTATKQSNGTKLNTQSKSSTAYKNYLLNQQAQSLNRLSRTVGRTIHSKFNYYTVFNGFAVELTQKEAKRIAALPDVKSIQAAPQYKIQTDRGPLIIKAPSAWDGSATGLSVKGEGIIIGIIDTGIRHDHASFAAISPADGYVHNNPLGNGIFLGYCKTTPDFCNNKLIGAYNFADGVDDPEDENRHGTHVASIAAGNRLNFDLGSGNNFNLTGVAPRANIIAYRIADSEGTSSPGASLAAIEQAVIDNVDVINYSFGGDAFDPWTAPDSIAFRNARAAGIIVTTSAGNQGPNPASIGSPADSPWITSVAASTHDRGVYPGKSMSDMAGGTSAPPSDISGRSLTGEITDSIVYAGNFSNGDPNPEQCLTAFPAGTFNGQIVVCDRGDIARVQKAKHVANGGAGGYVLANVQGGASFLADDIYDIPGIHIGADDADRLKLWLSSGDNHLATINGTNGTIGINASGADIVASFSSRGENPSAQAVIKPSITAPGVSILAAGIGEVDYDFLQGTSMASPHAAGAAALIKQTNPDWSAGQIHSALVLSSEITLLKEDGITVANPFDIGGGRININDALNTGLLVDESITNFIAADPSSGGKPGKLNLPSLASSDCTVSCSWSREITAAVTGTWSASFLTDQGLILDVAPATFSLSQNQSQALTISANISGDDGQWLFGRLLLTPDDSAVSTTQFPVAVKVNNSNLPERLTINAQRNAGQQLLSNITSVTASAIQAQGFLAISNPIQRQLEVDSDNSDAFDDLTDGINVELISVPTGSQLVFVETSNSTATDLDLFVGFDSNDDGQAQESELLTSSTSPDANEQILITKPRAGTYWAVIQNWSGSENGDDNYIFESGSTSATSSNDINIDLPSFSDGVTPFEIALNYNNINNQKFYGALTLDQDGRVGELGVSAFVINRVANDVIISSSQSSVAIDTNLTITVTITPDTNQSLTYVSSIEIPEGISIDTNSITNGANLEAGSINWDISVSGGQTSFTFNASANSSLAGQTVNLSITHSVDRPNAKQENSTTSFSVLNQNETGGNSGSSSGGGASLILILLSGLLFLIRTINKNRILNIKY